jgi:hypothetical protein
MTKTGFALIISLLFIGSTFSQNRTQHLVVVTLDGMRWHEIFKGIDDSLVASPQFTAGAKELRDKFGGQDAQEKRRRLFPFLWGTVEQEGQLYGNRIWGNKVDNANPYWFSYPGYNEIFTGYPDTAVNTNDKVWNKNENVLGFLNRQKGFTGKIAAFTTWDVFPYILNETQSGVYVNADVDTLYFKDPSLKLINDMQFLTTRPIGVRPDIFTYMAAREYLKAYHPRVLYIAFDETDDFAHQGLYDQYIGSAHAQDRMIADLWGTLQSMPEYKGTTTLVVTCDHGRGDMTKSDWQHHGSKIADAHEIWLAVMGPDTQPLGEVRQPMQLYQKQIAGGRAHSFHIKKIISFYACI